MNNQNSRYCGAELGTPKGYSPDYCRNVVQIGTPTCQAGHNVPNIGATPVAQMTDAGSSQSAYAKQSIAPSVEVTPDNFPGTIDFSEIESFLASETPSFESAPVHEPSVAEMDAILYANDSSRAAEIHDQFTEVFGLKPEFMQYAGTVRGERQKVSGGTAPFELDRFLLNDDKNTIMAFGDYGNPHALYMESSCNANDCNNRAYTRLHIVQSAVEECASKEMTLDVRRSDLRIMLSDASKRSKDASCDKHREPSDSMHQGEI